MSTTHHGPAHTNRNMVSKGGDRQQHLLRFCLEVAYLGIMCAGSVYLARHLRDMMDPTKSSTNKQASKSIRDRLERLLSDRDEEDGDDETKSGDDANVKERLSELVLSEHEITMAENVIDPKDITVRFGDIGGIDSTKSEIWDLVVLPLKRPDLFVSESGLLTAPKGILLYGQPGTGKTMLAKAIAKESGATFINVRLSSILNKWFGESNKSIAAIFSLAEKLSPSIIFIDEIDTFLGQREGHDSSTAGSIKSEFMTLWDGMLTGNFSSKPIMVLGATNHPYEVDAAILRRLPRTFEIGLPSMESRLSILKIILEKQPMTSQARDLIPAIADQTVGYSGSDLKELCRAAAMQPVREMTAGLCQQAMDGEKIGNQGPAIGMKVRPLKPEDFAHALNRVKRTGESAAQFYAKKQSYAEKSVKGMGNFDMKELTKGVALLRHLLGENGDNDGGDEYGFENIPNL